MPYDNPFDPEADEVLAKELGNLQAAGCAPAPSSPDGRRLYEAAERHRGRELAKVTGRPVAVGHDEPPRFTAPMTSMLPNAVLLKSVEGLAANDPVRLAIEAQAQTIRNYVSAKEQLVKALNATAAKGN